MIVRRYPLQWFNYYDFWKLPGSTQRVKAPGEKERQEKTAPYFGKPACHPLSCLPLGVSYLQSYLQDRLPNFDIRVFDMNL